MWYAIEFPETNKFAIVNLFHNDEDRNVYLAGKFAAALSASVDELLVASPDTVQVDVLAAKV